MSEPIVSRGTIERQALQAAAINCQQSNHYPAGTEAHGVFAEVFKRAVKGRTTVTAKNGARDGKAQ